RASALSAMSRNHPPVACHANVLGHDHFAFAGKLHGRWQQVISFFIYEHAAAEQHGRVAADMKMPFESLQQQAWHERHGRISKAVGVGIEDKLPEAAGIAREAAAA